MSFSKYVIEFAEKLSSGAFTKELMSGSEIWMHKMVSTMLKDSLASEAGVKTMDRLYNMLHEQASKNEQLSGKCNELSSKVKVLEGQLQGDYKENSDLKENSGF